MLLVSAAIELGRAIIAAVVAAAFGAGAVLFRHIRSRIAEKREQK